MFFGSSSEMRGEYERLFKSLYKSPDPNFWSHQLNTPTINNWQGLSFERICMCHIENIKKALGISAIAAEYFSWRSEESKPAAQIDLLIERADRVVNVCEMKYCLGEYALKKEEDLKMRNRIEAYKSESKTKCAVMPVLVTHLWLAEEHLFREHPECNRDG